jgi:hypothetical protein
MLHKEEKAGAVGSMPLGFHRSRRRGSKQIGVYARTSRRDRGSLSARPVRLPGEFSVHPRHLSIDGPTPVLEEMSIRGVRDHQRKEIGGSRICFEHGLAGNKTGAVGRFARSLLSLGRGILVKRGFDLRQGAKPGQEQVQLAKAYTMATHEALRVESVDDERAGQWVR